MKIEHIAMYVNDLEQAKDFFVKYFEAEAGELYHNPTKKFKSYFLTFTDGARLEIMTKEIMDNLPKSDVRTGYIHIAFSVGSKEKVDQITQKLVKDGFECQSGPRITGDGYYESCIVAIENNLIEITI